MISRSLIMDKENPVDMSSQAIDTRFRRVSQLRRLCLSLGKAGSKATAEKESPIVENSHDATTKVSQDRDS
jgi:hypothetical protein